MMFSCKFADKTRFFPNSVIIKAFIELIKILTNWRTFLSVDILGCFFMSTFLGCLSTWNFFEAHDQALFVLHPHLMMSRWNVEGALSVRPTMSDVIWMRANCVIGMLALRPRRHMSHLFQFFSSLFYTDSMPICNGMKKNLFLTSYMNEFSGMCHTLSAEATWCDRRSDARNAKLHDEQTSINYWL